MGKRLIPKFNNTLERDAFRLQVCKEFISSGLTKVAFCDKREVSQSALYRWLGYFKDKPELLQLDKQLNLSKDMSKPALNKKASVKHNFLRVNIEQQEPMQTNNSTEIIKAAQPAAELFFPNGLRLIIHAMEVI
jgi:hypothetical protein